MGTKSNEAALNLPQGVELRRSGQQTSLRIRFVYKGAYCRETLRMAATPSNIKFAARLRSEILNAIERGTFSYAQFFPDSKKVVLFGGQASNKITIAALLDRFLERAQNTLQKSTYLGYRRVCDKHLYEAFGKIQVRNLTPALIRNWVANQRLTTKTINNILIPLRAILDEATNDEIILRNPFDTVVVSRLIDKKVAKSDYEPDPFDRNEINAILAHCEGQVRNYWQFAFFTGLRPSEQMALEWKDIDWVNGIIKVRRAYVEREEKCTKTEAGERGLLLLPPALEALQAQKAHTFLIGKRVFHNPRTNQPWETPHQIRHNIWVRVLKKAGVRYRNPYQTRHTYASMMLSAGENMLWLARQMGHRDTEMIIRTYAKWIPDTSSKAGYKPVNDWGIALKTSAQYA